MQHVRGPFPPKFRVAAGAVALAVCAAAAATPVGAQQAIYKWVDERGVVNYGNAEVPKNVAVSLVDTAPAVVLRSDPKPAENAVRPNRLSDADVLREQLARSQEEIARLRQVAAGAAAQRSDGYAAWKAQCESERRVDCDEETYAAESRAGGVMRRPVVVAPKPVSSRQNEKVPALRIAGAPKASPKLEMKATTSLQ